MRGELNAEPDRARLVQALIEIFSEADRGSDRLGLQRIAVEGSEQLDLERFSVFFRYLENEYGAQLPARLNETTNVLRTIENGAEIEPEKKQRAETLLAAFLDAIRRDRALQPLLAPYVVTYG